MNEPGTLAPSDDPAPRGQGQDQSESARLRQALALLHQHQAQLGADVVARAAQGLQQRLDALASPVPRLRHVSVLFVDIAGSTALLQALDAEDSHAVLDGALRRFAEAVQRHGGRVLRFMGDGLKAAFGLPEPQDDDALRAVHAAHEVLAQAQDHAQAMRARLGTLRFAVRAGLHTGPVAMGVGAEDAQTLVGATVHLAARLEKHAEPGTLLVSHDTWRLTRGAFDFQVLPPLRVKGVADAVLTYRLLGERASGQRASGRGIDGLDTALVGRAAPLAALDAAVRALAPGAPGRMVTVLGDAGVGKSRLRQALLQSLADPMAPSAAQVLPAQAWPETERTPWGLLRDLLLRHADLAGSEPAAAAFERLREALLPALADDPLAPARVQALAYAIGLLDPAQAQATGLTSDARTLRAAVQGACLAWLRGLLQRGPVLLLLDDLHWADDSSLDLVLQCWRELAAQPLGIVALARPSLVQRRPDWPVDGAQQRRIALDPLDADAAEALIEALLGRLQPVPPLLRQALVERSGGNPYFIEELVCMLIDSGTLDTSGPVWRLQGDADGLQRLPGTLAGVLQARLGQLGPVERLALQQAAVVGPLFDEPALAAIDPAAPRALAALHTLGLLLPETGGAWRFHHQLLQQAAYDSVPRQDREPWHARVAAHLAGLDDSPAQWIASHFERAGDTAAAVQHYRRAALGDSSRMPRAELRHAARRALALAPDADAAERWALQLQEAICSSVLDDLDAVNASVPALRALAEALDDDGLRAEAERLALSTERPLWSSPERLAAVVALAERAHAKQPGERLPRLLGIHAWSLLNKERVEEARAQAERGIALAAEAGVPPPHQVLESAGIAAWKVGDLSAGLAHIEAVHRQAAARGDASVQIATLGNLAAMARTLGDRATWQQALDQAFAITERSGLVFGLPLLRVRRAQLLQHDGQPDAALAELRRGLALLPPSDRWYRITMLLAMGHAHLAAAQLAQAREAFAEALAGAVDAGMRAEAHQGLVLAALAEADATAAATHADALLQAMADPEPGDATERPAQWLAVADARTAAGDTAAAGQALAAAYEELMGQAARISDAAVRERFLSEVPHNRRIRQAAARAGLGGVR
ncbi:adenylate/guanylate cyclase domain-containing protein [Aquabacterium sp.]|uniref:adenylate/guanylate cyclase domain-containing protein n=1 Tax=Aquabacterium sp. TaxID=1872578 RepID=UPI003784EE0F